MGSPRSSSLHVRNPFAGRAPVPEAVPEEMVPVPGPLDAKNYAAAAVWAVLVGWAFLLAPGALGSSADNDMIQLLVSQPVPRPEGVNELWFGVWNCFAVVPTVIAALEAPVGRGQRLPATPFLWGSVAFGFFALGPYFATRTVRDEPAAPGDLGFASRNIFENKAFAAALAALAVSIPFTSDLIGCDFPAVLAGFADLASGSRFVAVASADIAIMSVLAAVLVSEDARRRGWEDKSLPLLAAMTLLPVVGPSLYLLVRPSLEEA